LCLASESGSLASPNSSINSLELFEDPNYSKISLGISPLRAAAATSNPFYAINTSLANPNQDC
jgi:hypothetical protein